MNVPAPPDGPPLRVMVVDDDAGMRDSLVDLLCAAGWTAEAFGRAHTALASVSGMQPDVVLSDVRMPGLSGLDLLRELAGPDMPPVVLISAHGDIPMAVEAMREGAYSFVEKPHEPHRLLSILRHAADQHRMVGETRRLRDRLASLSRLDRILLGETAEIRALRREVLDLADVPAPVLLLGETGTGKELVARALHDLGPWAARPFVALNAATLAPERFDAGMYGAGSAGGTLFLDEICACPMPAQAAILRIVDGPDSSTAGLPCRIVSASNEDPEAAMREERLRPDLFYRLNAVTLRLPSLRQRRDDLPLLFAHFVSEYAGLYEVAPPDITNDDRAALLAHDWPGNVRELRHVAERRVLAARRGRGSVAEAIAADQRIGDVPATLREAVAAFERELVGQAIRAHQGQMDAVAEALGIGRRTLNEKIVKLGLDKHRWLDGMGT